MLIVKSDASSTLRANTAIAGEIINQHNGHNSSFKYFSTLKHYTKF